MCDFCGTDGGEERGDAGGLQEHAGRGGSIAQGVLEVGGVGEAMGRLALQGAVDCGSEGGRQIGTDGACGRYWVLQHAVQGSHGVIGAEEALSVEELPGDDTEGEDVGASVDGLAVGLLGREVGELAAHLIAGGFDGSVEGASDAEVRYTRDTVLTDKDILGRDVAVDDAERGAVAGSGLMSVVQTAAGIGEDAGGDVRGDHETEAGGAGCELSDTRADDEVHHEVGGAVVIAAEVEGLYDMGAADSGRETRFLEEELDELFVGGESFGEVFDGNDAFEPGFAFDAPGKDLGHATGRDASEDAIASE